jgi:chemotaxis protein MotB
MIRRKPIEDEEESPERWLVSYADFITLLFAFFVVMYAISSVNQSKYTDLTSSMGTAFSGVNPAGNIKNQMGSKDKIKGQPSALVKPLPLSHLHQEKIRREREAMTNMGIELSNSLAPLISEDKVHVLQNNRGIRIDIHDSLLFAAGSAELAPAASNIMSEIAAKLKDNQRKIQVEGHTDNTEIHNDIFYSNWELSAVRASSVVRMLSGAGIEESRLSALGFGSTQPISENDTSLGRAKNRRVSMMILYESQNQEDIALEIKPQQKS